MNTTALRYISIMVVSMFIFTDVTSQPKMSLWHVNDAHQHGHEHGSAEFWPCGDEYYINYTGPESSEEIIIDILNEGDEDLIIDLPIVLENENGTEFSIISQPLNSIIGVNREESFIIKYSATTTYLSALASISILSNNSENRNCNIILNVGNDTCTENADCGNNANCDGGNCVCNDGYAGDGINCTDIDECAAGTANCSPFANCSNTDGGFTCDCIDGYIGDGTTCEPCDAGKFENNGVCSDCPAGRISNAGANECTDCLTDTYENGTRTACMNCPANSTSPSGSDNIDDCICNGGYTRVGSNCVLINVACNTNQYSDYLILTVNPSGPYSVGQTVTITIDTLPGFAVNIGSADCLCDDMDGTDVSKVFINGQEVLDFADNNGKIMLPDMFDFTFPAPGTYNVVMDCANSNFPATLVTGKRNISKAKILLNLNLTLTAGAAIPTVGQWGLITLGLLCMIFGMIGIRHSEKVRWK